MHRKKLIKKLKIIKLGEGERLIIGARQAKSINDYENKTNR